MKAAVCTKYGTPDVIEIREVSDPIPNDNELLIHIKATAVNSGDVRTRSLNVKQPLKTIMRLILGWSKPKKPILGTVFSGVTPDNVEVYGCSEGMNFSTHAEMICINKESAYGLKPDSISHQEAVSYLFGFTTAQYFLDKASLQPNDSILIYGASGAVGIAATQISKIHGSYITTVTSTKNLSLMSELGADETLDYTDPQFKLIENTYDVVFDCVGKLNQRSAKRSLKKNGVYLTVGGLDVSKETKEQIENLSHWIKEGLVKPVIDSVYDFKEIQKAHQHVDDGHKVGSVVINLEN